MTRHFLKQLLPFGILAGLLFATGTKAGINPMGKVWIYSCTFSIDGSVGTDGFVGIAGSGACPLVIEETIEETQLT